MNITPTTLAGLYIIETAPLLDDRGIFVKTFNREVFASAGLRSDFVESYYSVSKKNAIRGMHYQAPPHDHVKLVYVTRGKILDVVLDIRKGSPTYGKCVTVELSEENRTMVYVPLGCAHGFLSLQGNSCVTYLQTSTYAPDHDRGVRFDSFGKDWGIAQPILSARDQAFPTLRDLQSPFTYNKV